VFTCGLSGYVLSLDWFGLCDANNWKQMSAHIQTNSSSKVSSNGARDGIRKRMKTSQSKEFLVALEVLTHLLFFGFDVAVIVLSSPTVIWHRMQLQADNGTSNYLKENNFTTQQPPLGNLTLDNLTFGCSEETFYSGWVIIGVCLIYFLCNELQKVYCFFGLVRSPLYNGLSNIGLLCAIIWSQVRYFAFSFLTGLLLTYHLLTLIKPWTAEDWKLIQILSYIRGFRWI